MGSSGGTWSKSSAPGARRANIPPYTLGIDASTVPVAACRSGGAASDLSPWERQPDGAVVGDTHPMASRALLLAVPPLDQEHPALGGAGPGLLGGGPAVADGEGTQVPKGRQQRGHQSGLRAIPLVEAEGPPKRGCRAIPPAEGVVEQWPRTPPGPGGRAARRTAPI